MVRALACGQPGKERPTKATGCPGAVVSHPLRPIHRQHVPAALLATFPWSTSPWSPLSHSIEATLGICPLISPVIPYSWVYWLHSIPTTPTAAYRLPYTVYRLSHAKLPPLYCTHTIGFAIRCGRPCNLRLRADCVAAVIALALVPRERLFRLTPVPPQPPFIQPHSVLPHPASCPLERTKPVSPAG
jgi:hypothetical protein